MNGREARHGCFLNSVHIHGGLPVTVGGAETPLEGDIVVGNFGRVRVVVAARRRVGTLVKSG